MSSVKRLFVEKRPGFDVEARHMLADLRENLGIAALEAVRVVNRYDLEGVDEADFDRASRTILSEPNVDTVSAALSVEPGWRVFATEYLPGQYDQRADSAAQCIALLTQGERPSVLSARVIALKGDLTDKQFEAVKNYLINPVESREAAMELPESLQLHADKPADIERVAGFIQWTHEEIARYHAKMGFAMSVADLVFCRDYFRDTEKRDPAVTELKVIDTYWSDHCRHTTFLTQLDTVDIEKGPLARAIESAWLEYVVARTEVYQERKKDMTLMDMATIGTKVLKKRGLVPDLDESEEINACSIEVPVEIDGKTETWLVQFKNETHNHPTEIEPFGGAATCLGGAIRDPLSGRAYVYQAMRVTGSGNPLTPFEDTLAGNCHRRRLLSAQRKAIPLMVTRSVCPPGRL